MSEVPSGVRAPETFRVVSWNVNYRVGDAARREGAYLATLAPDLVLLQETNPNSIEDLLGPSHLAWHVRGLDVAGLSTTKASARRRATAVGGRRGTVVESFVLPHLDFPEKVLVVVTPIFDRDTTVLSYHAPPGVSWAEKKPAQAVAVACWLEGRAGPRIFGGDFNTPEVDAVDFTANRTHWHTGLRRLKGLPGDDVLVGPSRRHGLDDALRRWEAMGGPPLASVTQAGPLAISHRTGKRRVGVGNPVRYDAVWVSTEFEIERVSYPYEESIAAGSDHSAVVVDLRATRKMNRGG